MKVLKPGEEYKNRKGQTIRIKSGLYSTDDNEKAQSGATYVVNSNHGWYWYDGPMAGLFLDGRNLTNYKDRNDPNDILLPDQYKHVQLSLL